MVRITCRKAQIGNDNKTYRNKLTAAAGLVMWRQAIRGCGIADSRSEADVFTLAQTIEAGLADPKKSSPDDLRRLIDSLRPDDENPALRFGLALPSARLFAVSA